MEKGIFEGGQEDAEVSAALGGLKKVYAPMSFEANVRSAIDAGRDRTFFSTPGFILGLKFALPSVVLLALGVFLIFSSGGPDAGQIAQRETAAPPVSVDVPSGVPVSGPPANQVNNMIAGGAQVNRQPAVNRPVRANQKAANDRVFRGGSRDLALSPDNTAILPKSMNPDQKLDPARRGLDPAAGSITVVAILSKLGASANCTENGCTATSIQPGSAAERSGIKKGDLLEAINGKPVRAGKVLEAGEMIRNVTLLREGDRITIQLGGK